MTKLDDTLDRGRITSRILEFTEALGGEGFTDDDINDGLFRAAYRRIKYSESPDSRFPDRRAEYLD